MHLDLYLRILLQIMQPIQNVMLTKKLANYYFFHRKASMSNNFVGPVGSWSTEEVLRLVTTIVTDEIKLNQIKDRVLELGFDGTCVFFFVFLTRSFVATVIGKI